MKFCKTCGKTDKQTTFKKWSGRQCVLCHSRQMAIDHGKTTYDYDDGKDWTFLYRRPMCM